MILSDIPRPKSPRIEPGAASYDLVAPTKRRVVATALFPSITAATTGPDVINETSSPKNGFVL